MILLRNKKNKSRGVTTVEYCALVVMILSAFWFGLRGYIQRGMQGRWKAAGDAFGQGRQFEPKGDGAVSRTEECFYSEEVHKWVDLECFETDCDCTKENDDADYATTCLACMNKLACLCTF